MCLPPLAEHDAIWCGISLWSFWVSCPGSFCTPSSFLAGQYKKPKSTGLDVSTVQQQLQRCCVISIIHTLNPEHSTIVATGKKTNLIPAETRTPFEKLTLKWQCCKFWTVRGWVCHGDRSEGWERVKTKTSSLFFSFPHVGFPSNEHSFRKTLSILHVKCVSL